MSPILTGRKFSYSNSILGLGFLLFTVIGCGNSAKDPQEGQREEPIIPIVLTEDPPMQFALADPECQGEVAPVELKSGQIYQWQDAETAARVVDLGPLETTESLSSLFIKQTTYGQRYVRYCNWQAPNGTMCLGEDGQQKPWVTTPNPNLLRVCRDNSRYDRQTYEATALTSAYYLQNADSIYRAVSGSGAAPITLSVLPHFIDYYDNFVSEDGEQGRLKTFITRNLAYFPGESMIAILPESVERPAQQNGFFWESGFALTHEYGHHVDAMLNGGTDTVGAELAKPGSGLVAGSSLAAAPSRTFDPPTVDPLTFSPISHSWNDAEAFQIGLGSRSGRAVLRGAIAEAFADLIAYYSEGANAESLVGLPCFGYNRDVGNSYFANGDEKSLTEDRFELLLGWQPEGKLDDCTVPAYSNIHTGGAIIATTMHRVISALVAVRDPNFDGRDIVALTADHGYRNRSGETTPWNTDSEARADRSEDRQAALGDYLDHYRLALSWLRSYTEVAANLQATDDEPAVLLSPLSRSIDQLVQDNLTGASLTQEQNEGAQSELCQLIEARLPVMPSPSDLCG